MDHLAVTLLPSLPVRLARAVHLAALATALSVLGSLLILAVPAIRAPLGQPITDASESFAVAVVAFVGLAVVVVALALVLLIYGQCRGWLRRPHFIALWALVLAAGTYFAWDDAAVRYPLTFEDLVPTQPGDDTSFALLLRYGKNTPATNAVALPKLQLGAAANDLSAHPEKWIAFLRSNQTEIEDEWAKLAPVRAWWDELAALPRIGDLTNPHPDAPILAFQPTRLHAQLAVAIASLQALDGHGDEALATLTRLYSVGRKFESNSRTSSPRDDRQGHPKNVRQHRRLRARPHHHIAGCPRDLRGRTRRRPGRPNRRPSPRDH